MSSSIHSASSLKPLQIVSKKIPRLLCLDLFRGIAVLWMIETHVLDASLAKIWKQGWLFDHINLSNGFVSVSFLFCAGAGLWIRLSEKWDALKSREPLWGALLRRLGQILLIAYALNLRYFIHFPPSISWYDVTRVFSGDILQVIAIDSFLAVFLFSLISSRRVLKAVYILFIALMFLSGPILGAWDPRPVLPLPFSMLLVSYPIAQFPLIPWSGYFFAGAGVAAFFLSTPHRKRAAFSLLIFAVALLGFGHFTQNHPSPYLGFVDWYTSVGHSLFRIGIVIFVFSVFYLVDAFEKLPRIRALQLLGQESLFAYVLQMGVIFGFLRGFWPNRFDPFATAAIVVAVSIFCTIATAFWKKRKVQKLALPIKSLALLIFLPLLVLNTSFVARAQTRPAHQTLFIGLDGVPYHIVKELKDAGHFQEFQEPTKVISTFPSTTTTGFGALFHPIGAEHPAGYDRQFFSYEKNAKQSLFSLIHIHSNNDFRNFFSYYRKSPLEKFWIYSTPSFAARLDLDRIQRVVHRKPDHPYYFTYVGGTDGIGHVLGEKRLKRWLIAMDKTLIKFRADYRRLYHQDLQISLFSDHGFHFEKDLKAVSKREIVKRLKAKGFKFARNLKKDHQVIVIVWGNISGASFYAHPSRVEQVASILSETRGMDLVAYRLDRTLFVLSRHQGFEEKAKIECVEETQRCRYVALQGDPLHYLPVLAQLELQGKVFADGSVSFEDWFQATKNLEYPDALTRLHDGFFSLVQNPAPILCSMDPQYEYGSAFTRFGAMLHGGIKGTHGGIFQEASGAMILTTDVTISLPAEIRYNEVMPRLLKLEKEVAPNLLEKVRESKK